ncbi:MAG: S4 domain-containing protein YaaA [Bacilli bacterium]|nr:S4 domain-containing protein YaaA [Bacilli bacterium]
MEKTIIYTEYITLGQLLKFKGVISSGSEAKIFLGVHEVIVNGAKDNRRGRKLYVGDRVEVLKKEYLISKE